MSSFCILFEYSYFRLQVKSQFQIKTAFHRETPKYHTWLRPNTCAQRFINISSHKHLFRHKKNCPPIITIIIIICLVIDDYDAIATTPIFNGIFLILCMSLWAARQQCFAWTHMTLLFINKIYNNSFDKNKKQPRQHTTLSQQVQRNLLTLPPRHEPSWTLNIELSAYVQSK